MSTTSAATTLLGLADTPQQPYTFYTYNYTASLASTFLTFQFRQDPAYWALDDVSVTPQANLANQLIANGGFENGSTSWTSIGQQGLPAAGVINTGTVGPNTLNSHAGTMYWYDGAVGGVDGLYQAFPTTPGDVYVVSFWLANDGGSHSLALVQIGAANYDINGNILNSAAINALLPGSAPLPTPAATPPINLDLSTSTDEISNVILGTENAAIQRMNQGSLDIAHEDLSGFTSQGEPSIFTMQQSKEPQTIESLLMNITKDSETKVFQKENSAIWISYLGNFGSKRASTGNAQTSSYSNGGIVGIDTMIGKNMLGANIGYMVGQSSDKKTPLNQNNLKTVVAGSYFRLKPWQDHSDLLHPISFDFFANVAFTSSDQQRITNNTTMVMAKAHYRTLGLLGSTEMSYKHKHNGIDYIRPYIGLDYEQIQRPQYSETGAGSANLSFNEEKWQQWGTYIGLQTMNKFVMDNYKINLSFDIWYERKFGTKASTNLYYTQTQPNIGVIAVSDYKEANDVWSPSFTVSAQKKIVHINFMFQRKQFFKGCKPLIKGA